MKPYGVRVIEFPDVGDIQEMGAKSSAGRLKGDEHGYCRTKTKRRTRLIWKKRARAQAKKDCDVRVKEAQA
jgi:hypothetical protein